MGCAVDAFGAPLRFRTDRKALSLAPLSASADSLTVYCVHASSVQTVTIPRDALRLGAAHEEAVTAVTAASVTQSASEDASLLQQQLSELQHMTPDMSPNFLYLA